jgi:two-component system, cell cycle response regulator
MSARILVVDDVLPNVKLLEAKLTAEYYQVIVARNGPEALERVTAEDPDLVLLDVMMPGMDGYEVCRRMKGDPRTAHIPVVMVTALSEANDRVRGLEAGADDFLTKPVNDIALFARVRSLVRLKMTMDELRHRNETSSSFGVTDEPANGVDEALGAKVLVVEDRAVSAERMAETLRPDCEVTVLDSGELALDASRSGDWDLILISLGLKTCDPLRLCSQLRTLEETRQAPILVVGEDAQPEIRRIARALDIGAHDYLLRPIDKNELKARARTQIRRKRYGDKLRQNYQMSLTLAVTDALTGLYNRRYLSTHLDNLAQRAAKGGKAVAVMMLDIDHFKRVNDTHGHGVGDEVLKEFAHRLSRGIRGIDLAARVGGEEFVVVMPDTDMAGGRHVADRVLADIASEPFATAAASLPVSTSIGLTVSSGPDDTRDALLARADKALYAAKQAGRNRVEVE